jgi:hypothetical protein
MKSRYCVVSILLLNAFCLPFVYAQEEQWLQYRHSREAQEILRQFGSQMLVLVTSRPQEVNLPELADKDPIFAKWATPMVQAGYVWLLLAKSSPQGIHDQLLIDSNCDGRLDDEEPIKAYRMDTRSSYFGPVKLVFDSDDGPISFHLNLRYYGQENYERLDVYAGGWYEGTVTVAGQQLHCVLADQNANGAFDDKALDFSQADRISVGPKDNPQFRLMGKFLGIGKALYAIEASRDGAFVVFSEAQGVEYGELGLPKGITAFGAGGALGQFDCVPEAGIVKLPVGEYKVEHWAITRKDKQGHTWQVKGQSFGKKGVFQVSSAQRTELKVGEPLLAKLQVSRNNTQYSFNQTLKGSLGEGIELLRNGTRPRAPKLHIKNKTGSYERTFNFEYG